jgi:hypothetical protein
MVYFKETKAQYLLNIKNKIEIKPFTFNFLLLLTKFV